MIIPNFAAAFGRDKLAEETTFSQDAFVYLNMKSLQNHLTFFLFLVTGEREKKNVKSWRDITQF